MARRAEALLAALAVASAMAAFGARAQSLNAPPSGDFVLVCASARVLETGGNAYEPAETTAAGAPAGLLMTHPPLVARGLAPACAAPGVLVSSVAALLLTLIAWRLLGASLLFAATAVISGFAAFPWILISGNSSMLEAIAVGVACWALLSDRPAAFGLSLGPAVYLKSFVPLPFAAAALVRWDLRRATAALALLAAVIALLFGADWVFDRASAADYWNALLTKYGPWGMAELRGGGEYSPSPYAFLPIATAHVGAGRTPGGLAAAGLSLAFVFAWYRRARASSGSPADRAWLALLAIAVLVVIHPRFKPYSPFVLAPALALFLTGLPTSRARCVALILACVLPNLMLLALTLSASGPRLPSPIIFALQYSQWICAAIVVALALRFDARDMQIPHSGRR